MHKKNLLKKSAWIYDSLCCTPETNTVLQINCTPIKIFLIKKNKTTTNTDCWTHFQNSWFNKYWWALEYMFIISSYVMLIQLLGDNMPFYSYFSRVILKFFQRVHWLLRSYFCSVKLCKEGLHSDAVENLTSLSSFP